MNSSYDVLEATLHKRAFTGNKARPWPSGGNGKRRYMTHRRRTAVNRRCDDIPRCIYWLLCGGYNYSLRLPFDRCSTRNRQQLDRATASPRPMLRP